jgi:hypothetical protein
MAVSGRASAVRQNGSTPRSVAVGRYRAGRAARRQNAKPIVGCNAASSTAGDRHATTAGRFSGLTASGVGTATQKFMAKDGCAALAGKADRMESLAVQAGIDMLYHLLPDRCLSWQGLI